MVKAGEVTTIDVFDEARPPLTKVEKVQYEFEGEDVVKVSNFNLVCCVHPAGKYTE